MEQVQRLFGGGVKRQRPFFKLCTKCHGKGQTSSFNGQQEKVYGERWWGASAGAGAGLGRCTWACLRCMGARRSAALAAAGRARKSTCGRPGSQGCGPGCEERQIAHRNGRWGGAGGKACCMVAQRHTWNFRTHVASQKGQAGGEGTYKG